MPTPLRLLLIAALTIVAACSSDEVDSGADTAPQSEAAAADDTGLSDDTGLTDDTGSSGEAAPPADADEIPLGEQWAEVVVDGEPLEVMPPRTAVTDPSNDPAIGQVAPELTGTDFAGTPVAVVADGTPRVVMFVTHWCGHCQREIPAVKALIEDGAVPDGLELIVVSTAVRDDGPNYPPQTWLENEAWPGPVIRDSEQFEALFAFGAGGFPFSVYLNADHEVVARSAGELPADVLQQLWLATVDG